MESKACSSLFDDFIMVFCKYFLYYYEDTIDNIDTSRSGYQRKAFMFEDVLKDIYKLADVYQKYYEL